MATEHASHLAMLIDGDNISPKYIAGLIAELAKYGTVSVRRIYGDWTSPSLKGWKACLLNHSITPMQQFGYTTGKNSTDGAMIIDAMDLLYTGRFSGFCIVSSDSDFTRLAARIREQGVTVYGFGERKTTTSFIAACDKFVYLDALDAAPGEPVNPPVGQPTPQASARDTRVVPEIIGSSQGMEKTKSLKRPLDQTALDKLAKAIKSSIGVHDNYANLAEVGAYLSRTSSDLNARNYGYDRLKDLVEASGIADIKWRQTEKGPPVCCICLKENANWA